MIEVGVRYRKGRWIDVMYIGMQWARRVLYRGIVRTSPKPVTNFFFSDFPFFFSHAILATRLLGSATKYARKRLTLIVRPFKSEQVPGYTTPEYNAFQPPPQRQETTDQSLSKRPKPEPMPKPLLSNYPAISPKRHTSQDPASHHHLLHFRAGVKHLHRLLLVRSPRPARDSVLRLGLTLGLFLHSCCPGLPPRHALVGLRRLGCRYCLVLCCFPSLRCCLSLP